MTVWAVAGIDPPPVNQNLGMPDTQFFKLFESLDADKGARTCKRCHKPEFYGCEDPDVLSTCVQKPDGIPALLSMYLPDRHHRNVGTEIAGGPEQPPFMDADKEPGPDTHYKCLNCHKIAFDAEGEPVGLVQNFRNCLNCHKVTGVEAVDKPRTVHHDTPKAWAGQCGVCHGYLVRSLDEGDAPRTYQPSMITPQPRGKLKQDLSITGKAGTHPGNCDFCHNVTLDELDAQGKLKTIPAPPEFDYIDKLYVGIPDDSSEFSSGTPGLPFPGFGAIDITPNWTNHHMTGVPGFTVAEAGPEPTCDWCHYSTVLDHPQSIRGCQRCHDVSSLHSIEADVDGDGIVPGAETPYNGHIGNQSNCWGCHGFDDKWRTATQDDEIGTYAVGPTIPQLNFINAQHWPEGAAFNLELTGNGFVNLGVKYVDEVETEHTYMASVQFTNTATGDVTVLEPFTNEATRAVVAVPGNLPAGGYNIQIKKGSKLSNPIEATIIPTIGVNVAKCYPQYNAVVILTGEQFSQHLPVPGSTTGLTANGVEAGMIFMWEEQFIAAMFDAPGCPSSVEVHNVFGSTSVNVTAVQ